MSTVRLLRGADGHLMGYRITGHTGYAHAGQDIVCSALSFLAITCANALEAIAELKPAVNEEDGNLEVRLLQTNQQALTIMRVFELGIRDLQATYPRYIKLLYNELQD